MTPFQLSGFTVTPQVFYVCLGLYIVTNFSLLACRYTLTHWCDRRFALSMTVLGIETFCLIMLGLFVALPP